MQVLAYWLTLLVNNIGPAWNSIIVVAMINNYCTVDDLDHTCIYIQVPRSMVYGQ
jgi:hypothetical protein